MAAPGPLTAGFWMYRDGKCCGICRKEERQSGFYIAPAFGAGEFSMNFLLTAYHCPEDSKLDNMGVSWLIGHRAERKGKTNMFWKTLFLYWFGGSFYTTLEVFYRGKSHWTMFLLSGIVFLAIGAMNEGLSWETPLPLQALAGAAIATVGEFLTGCVVNLWLGWGIWDYSDMWGNLLGQVCPLFSVIWIPISVLAIVVDDVIRWRFFHQGKPRYKLF